MTKNKYKIGDVVDLGDVLITPAAFARWQVAAAVGAPALTRLFPGESLDIPDEQGLLLASGELEVFVEVRGVRIAMKVASDQWTWR